MKIEKSVKTGKGYKVEDIYKHPSKGDKASKEDMKAYLKLLSAVSKKDFKAKVRSKYPYMYISYKTGIVRYRIIQ